MATSPHDGPQTSVVLRAASLAKTFSAAASGTKDSPVNGTSAPVFRLMSDS